MSSILSKRVSELELTVRAYNCLANLNIVYVDDLVRMTPERLLRVPNMGRKSLTVIVEELERCGLHLGMKDEEILDGTHQSRANDLENFIRVMQFLRDRGIGSVSELVQQEEDELLAIPGMSAADLSAVHSGLEKWGLQLDMYCPPVPEIYRCEEANTAKEELLSVVTQLLSGARQNRAQCFISYHGIGGDETLTLQEIANRAVECGFDGPVTRERVRQVICEAEKRLRNRRENARFVKWQATVHEVEIDLPCTVQRFVSLFGYGSTSNPMRIYGRLKTISGILGINFPFESLAIGGDKIIIHSEDIDTIETARALDKFNSDTYYNLEESLKYIGCDKSSLTKVIKMHPRWAFLDDACQYFWKRPGFPLQNYCITGNAILTCLCKIFSVTRDARVLDLVQSIPRHKLVGKNVPSVVLKGIAQQSGLFEIENGNIVKRAECEWMTISKRDWAMLRVCVEHGQVVPSNVLYSSLVQYGLTAASAAITVAYSPFLIHIQSGVGYKEGIYQFILSPEKINLESLRKRIDDREGCGGRSDMAGYSQGVLI